MGTHDSEHSPPQKYGVNDSNYYQANQQEIIIALNFHVSRWSRANPIQKPETRENLVSRARTGGTGANLKCAKPNESRTRLFMFCIAPPTLAKVVCVGVCVRIMIFLVRNTLKQNERFKKKKQKWFAAQRNSETSNLIINLHVLGVRLFRFSSAPCFHNSSTRGLSGHMAAAAAAFSAFTLRANHDLRCIRTSVRRNRTIYIFYYLPPIGPRARYSFLYTFSLETNE